MVHRVVNHRSHFPLVFGLLFNDFIYVKPIGDVIRTVLAILDSFKKKIELFKASFHIAEYQEHDGHSHHEQSVS